MLKDVFVLRPRYDEVDQMGYVYHGSYVSYCHQARTELMRKYGINDRVLEARGIMMPVIDMQLKYHQPGRYDEALMVTTTVEELKQVRLHFCFEIRNEANEKICTARSTVVFVDAHTRKPMKMPAVVHEVLAPLFAG